MSTMQDALEVETEEYEQALRSIRKGGTDFSTHPGSGYLKAGFQDGYKRGFQSGAGAAHAGISTVIGNIDNGMYDAEDAKDALIALRNLIQRDAGL